MLTFVSARTAFVTSAVAMLALGLAAGCGSVAPVETFAIGEASSSAKAACASSGAALCERANACSPFWFAQFFTSVATCSAVYAEDCVDRYKGKGAAIEIADCSPAVAALSCEALLDPVLVTYYDPAVIIASCPVTPGVFGAGERCLRDGDCTTGHCSWNWKEGSCGKCVAPVEPLTFRDVGEACTSDAACASRWCSSGQCGEIAKLGEACLDRPCDLLAGLTCGSDFVCRPTGTVPLGQPCPGFDLCEAGATCKTDDPKHPATCVPRRAAGVGEDCTRGCAKELTCTNGKCAAPTRGFQNSCRPATSPQ
jgi:hypothetical protein